MSCAIIGKKLGMTQIFDHRGYLVPVTVVQAGPCTVVQRKTKENDGYSAIQIGYGKTGRSKRNSKPLKGHYQAAGIDPTRILKEVRIAEDSEYKVGDTITVERFKASDRVTVVGYTKGRGFAGVIKRHGFPGKDAGHGSHEYFRHGGSIGCRTPKHTIKGMRMPGRMGTNRVTTRNLRVIMIDPEKNLILIQGAVPGWNNGFVMVQKTNE
ncbi:50S ribosomal protein L3 [bacterium]|nr:50S ribosomal protein L3 [candidate division CSSED10-310 bacterium]